MKTEIKLLNDCIDQMQAAKVGRGFNNSYHQGRKSGLDQGIQIVEEAKKQFIAKAKAGIIIDFGTDFANRVKKFHEAVTNLQNATKKQFPSGGIVSESGPEIISADFATHGERDKTSCVSWSEDEVTELTKDQIDHLRVRFKEIYSKNTDHKTPDWIDAFVYQEKNNHVFMLSKRGMQSVIDAQKEQIENLKQDIKDLCSSGKVQSGKIDYQKEQISELKTGISQYIEDGRKQDVLISDLEQNCNFWIADCKRKLEKIIKLEELVSLQKISLKARDVREKMLRDRLSIYQNIESNHENIIFKLQQSIKLYKSTEKFNWLFYSFSFLAGVLCYLVFSNLFS